MMYFIVFNNKGENCRFLQVGAVEAISFQIGFGVRLKRSTLR
jgi:hypothetical protein